MDKDTIYGISILLTFIIGVWNFVQNWRAAKKTSFINTVTAQRVKWLEQMRQDVASFVGLTHNWAGIFTMKKKNIYVNQSQELLSMFEKAGNNEKIMCVPIDYAKKDHIVMF